MIPLILNLIACGDSDPKINRIEPDMAVAIESLDFGEVKVNENSIQTFQIINAGAATLRLTELSILDNDDSVYTLDMVVIGQSETNLLGDTVEIQPTDIANLTIQFLPTEFQDYNRSLEITSNDPELAVYNLPISGIGGDGPMPDIAIDNLALDFGSVAVGEAPLLYFTVHNQGDADLEIGSTTQMGSGAFSVIGDLDQKTLAPGVQTAIVVNYTPFQENGDSGSLTIPSNDPEQPSIDIQFIGNGGGDNTYPVADIACPTNVESPTQLTFDGSNSQDPNGEILTYNWSLITKPIGSVTALENTNSESSVLDVDLAGDYQVNLTVNNQSGFQSAPAECLFYAEPPSDIHVELSWNDPDADLDLHLTKAADGLFSLESDCCWCNPNPNWGEAGPEDDPILNADSEDNSAPEIIDIVSAADGDYYVRVHYFSDLGAGDVQATVRVYVSGVLEGQYTQQLIHNQAWEVGFVRWPLGLLAEESLPPSAYSGIRSCQ